MRDPLMCSSTALPTVNKDHACGGKMNTAIKVCFILTYILSCVFLFSLSFTGFICCSVPVQAFKSNVVYVKPYIRWCNVMIYFNSIAWVRYFAIVRYSFLSWWDGNSSSSCSCSCSVFFFFFLRKIQFFFLGEIDANPLFFMFLFCFVGKLCWFCIRVRLL